MHRGLLVNYKKVVKFMKFICGVKIKLRRKFSGICQVNPQNKTRLWPIMGLFLLNLSPIWRALPKIMKVKPEPKKNESKIP